jgi:hypothetical protein
MIKEDASWYTKQSSERTTLVVAGTGATSDFRKVRIRVDLVLTNNNQRRIAFWGIVLEVLLPRIDIW